MPPPYLELARLLRCNEVATGPLRCWNCRSRIAGAARSGSATEDTVIRRGIQGARARDARVTRRRAIGCRQAMLPARELSTLDAGRPWGYRQRSPCPPKYAGTRLGAMSSASRSTPQSTDPGGCASTRVSRRPRLRTHRTWSVGAISGDYHERSCSGVVRRSWQRGRLRQASTWAGSW